MRLPAPALFLLAGAALSACTSRIGIAAASATAAFGTRLGESSKLGSRTITPIAILEDSRCPGGAQCIHAGTVRLQVKVQRAAQANVAVVGLRSPADIGGAWLHLACVCPSSQLSSPIAPADYRLTLVISDSAALPAEPIACPPR